MLELQALDMARELDIPVGAFVASWRWRRGFLRRHRLASRCKIHQGQLTPTETYKIEVDSYAHLQSVVRNKGIATTRVWQRTRLRTYNLQHGGEHDANHDHTGSQHGARCLASVARAHLRHALPLSLSISLLLHGCEHRLVVAAHGLGGAARRHLHADDARSHGAAVDVGDRGDAVGNDVRRNDQRVELGPVVSMRKKTVNDRKMAVPFLLSAAPAESTNDSAAEDGLAVSPAAAAATPAGSAQFSVTGSVAADDEHPNAYTSAGRSCRMYVYGLLRVQSAKMTGITTSVCTSTGTRKIPLEGEWRETRDPVRHDEQRVVELAQELEQRVELERPVEAIREHHAREHRERRDAQQRAVHERRNDVVRHHELEERDEVERKRVVRVRVRRRDHECLVHVLEKERRRRVQLYRGTRHEPGAADHLEEMSIAALDAEERRAARSFVRQVQVDIGTREKAHDDALDRAEQRRAGEHERHAQPHRRPFAQVREVRDRHREVHEHQRHHEALHRAHVQVAGRAYPVRYGIARIVVVEHPTSHESDHKRTKDRDYASRRRPWQLHLEWSGTDAAADATGLCKWHRDVADQVRRVDVLETAVGRRRRVIQRVDGAASGRVAAATTAVRREVCAQHAGVRWRRGAEIGARRRVGAGVERVRARRGRRRRLARVAVVHIGVVEHEAVAASSATFLHAGSVVAKVRREVVAAAVRAGRRRSVSERASTH
ncbi:hypothetical protein PybrP1_012141 [[Pythium] brassicae (nom. inval.)]|nr:hypothetical protein PybrP1_012141 [[Pythium] brassicae (nom. inval.)]